MRTNDCGYYGCAGNARRWGKAARRRKKRVFRRRLLSLLLFAGICAGAGYVYTAGFAGTNISGKIWDAVKETFDGTYTGSGRTDSNSDDWRAVLNEMAVSNERIKAIVDTENATPGTYPEDVLKMIYNNPETLDFVEAYPEKKDSGASDCIGEVTQGTVPLLIQWDERWGYQTYGNTLLAVSGCGPTSLAMVIAGLTGNNTVTPYDVARYAEENGYYVSGEGSRWSLMSEGCQAFGICGEELSLSEGAIIASLSAGHPVICSMRPGDFTNTGHFIVITGVSNGMFQINDPNSAERSEQLWDYDQLSWQINNLWAFSLQ